MPWDVMSGRILMSIRPLANESSECFSNGKQKERTRRGDGDASLSSKGVTDAAYQIKACSLGEELALKSEAA